jgi:hypothetical protein
MVTAHEENSEIVHDSLEHSGSNALKANERNDITLISTSRHGHLDIIETLFAASQRECRPC